MVAAVTTLLRKMYACSPAWFLRGNAAIALLFVVSNGGALALATAHPNEPLAAQVIRETTISLPIATLCLLLSTLAWLSPRWIARALRVQSFVLLLLVAHVVLGAFAQFAPASPEPKDFWVVGYFTLLVFYALVSVARFGMSGSPQAQSMAFYLPAIAAGVAAVVDIAVFVHALAS